MAPLVTQPQAGDLLFAGQHIRVLSFPQAIAQAGDEHVIGRRQVGTVSTGFRTFRRFLSCVIAPVIRVTGKIPVPGLPSLGATAQGIIIRPGSNTPALDKLSY